ncbi:MAG: homoprotocatechuate degradation operon regulator HpaR [Pseudomonadota bacterium]|nr:homoprotocatechuate degradation operon regulator HpaR [Pseudomonadota bacterium]
MPLRSIDLNLPMQLLRAREAAMSRFRPMLRNHGLTEQQWRVLRVLAAEKQLDTGELSRLTFLLSPSLTRILKTLDQEGLVQRTPDPDDLRRVGVRLSKAGRKLYSKVSPDSERLYREIEDQFGLQKLNELYALLKDLQEAIDHIGAEAC